MPHLTRKRNTGRIYVVKLNPLRFFKSLSARLLLLTLIWVSFIVTTIGIR